ncbi:MAG: ATP-binding protein [bacterium]|nr:ATP-binding protein [bacterium]
MKLQQLLSYTRRAIDDYGMIEEGDRIAVGISGGKDSLTMLYAMATLRRFYPKSFEIEAISIDLGFGDMDFSKVEALCKELDVRFTVVPTQIFPIVFEERKESNPCSLCAKMRKGAFNDVCKELNCNKVAYAHHKDDLIETLLMSLLFEGRLGSFSPITYLDRTELTVIRPLMYVNEKDVIGFKNAYNLPVIKSPCPADGYTKRQYAKDLIKQLNKENPGVKERMFHAIITGNFEDWPKLVR